MAIKGGGGGQCQRIYDSYNIRKSIEEDIKKKKCKICEFRNDDNQCEELKIKVSDDFGCVLWKNILLNSDIKSEGNKRILDICNNMTIKFDDSLTRYYTNDKLIFQDDFNIIYYTDIIFESLIHLFRGDEKYTDEFVGEWIYHNLKFRRESKHLIT